MEFNFANWDFKSWFNQYVPDDLLSGTKKGILSRISYDNVYKYEYCDGALPRHGGVKVTCKDRLSRESSYQEADFGPIERVVDDTGTRRNVTTKDGIIFVMKPPDLRFPPSMEAYTEKSQSKTTREDEEDLPCVAAKGIGRAFPHLDEDSLDDWQALYSLHSQAPHSGALPHLPADVSFSRAGGPVKTRRFTGTPMDLKPILQGLQRFKRPLITWDIFNAEAPSTFPMAPLVSEEGQEPAHKPSTTNDTNKDVPLRDPRRVNQVLHADFTPAQFQKTLASLSAEDWVEDVPNRIEDAHWEEQDDGGGLYIVLLKDPDGEFLFGLGKDCGPSATPGSRTLQWFGRCSTCYKWPSTTKFDQDRWDVKESYPCEGFLLVVDEDLENGKDLTDSSTPKQPTLSAAFMARLKLFAGVLATLTLPLSAIMYL